MTKSNNEIRELNDTIAVLSDEALNEVHGGLDLGVLGAAIAASASHAHYASVALGMRKSAGEPASGMM